MAIYNFEEQKTKNKKTDYQKIVGVIIVTVSILCLFCLITHFVPFIKSFLLGIAGLFCYPFFITAMAVGFAFVGHKRYVMPRKYAIYLSLTIIFILAVFQLILVPNTGLNFWEYLSLCYAQKSTAGGIILGLVTAPVLYLLNTLGAYIIFIALSLIFVALTVDYIHYLSKNENLKKAINLVENKEVDSKPAKITVKELENNIKKTNKLTPIQNEEKPKPTVQLTLDAKQTEETQETSAKRRLGLLASSNQDAEDNSRYFKTANTTNETTTKPKITDTKKYILSGYTDGLDDYNKHRLNQIQSHIRDLKRTNTTKNDTENVSNDIIVNQKGLFDTNEILSQKHTITTTSPNVYVKATMSDENVNTLDSNDIDVPLEPKTIVEPSTPKAFSQDETNSSQVSKIEEEQPTIIENKTQNMKSVTNIDPMNVESLTDKILASLNQEQKPSNTANYVSAKQISQQSEEPKVIEPIIPKEPIEYIPPPIELLTTESMDLSLMNQDVVMKREELEIALDTFGIPAKVIGVVIGPAVTRYELEMPAGVSIKRLLALQEDIAYSLSSNGDIRIEAPIPGRRAVGIEVPNDQIATVGLRDIILSREFYEGRNNLSIALGKDISGAVKTFSLVKIPHLLIAGGTGSGKSVCINSIILSLIYRYSPDELKFILIDPKRVEFSMYNNLPHLLMPNVISDSEKALNALSWCVDEMERRFILFANARVKNLEEYNSSEIVLEGKAEKIPYIIFIIDELADLLMTSKKEAEEYICRILQKARAAGIHMILATQRPSVDIVTGKIKANLSARICFSLMTFADSKTVLDQGGADKLLGRGDMLFLSNDTGVPKRIQGCFVTTKEIDDVVTFVKENNAEYEFDMKTEQAILNPQKNDVVTQIDGDRASSDGYDVLMPQVLKAVIEAGHASISMIQRKFLVGFPRAARIIDQMEMAGYISPSDGTKTRSVYMTMDEYNNLYGEAE